MLLLKAPLHCLRKTNSFRYLLNSKLNSARFYKLGFSHKVALRPLTHASVLFNKSRLEPSIKNLITEVCKILIQENTGKCFFDVGANIGLYTWEASELSPELEVISFEPDPYNFELLQMTLNESKKENVKIFSYALSNHSGQKEFHQDNITSATGSLAVGEKSWVEKYLQKPTATIKVSSQKLDNFCQARRIPGLIKIDVEGHENEVIEGGMRTIETNYPLMIIESFPPKQIRVLERLLKIGYKVIDADRLSKIQNNTNNLFAWHPSGPIEFSKVQEIISK
jgi:FkbM family methyltransferase